MEVQRLLERRKKGTCGDWERDEWREGEGSKSKTKSSEAIDGIYGIRVRGSHTDCRRGSFWLMIPTLSKLLPFLGRKLSSSNSCSIMLFKGLILECS